MVPSTESDDVLDMGDWLSSSRFGDAMFAVDHGTFVASYRIASHRIVAYRKAALPKRCVSGESGVTFGRVASRPRWRGVRVPATFSGTRIPIHRQGSAHTISIRNTLIYRCLQRFFTAARFSREIAVQKFKNAREKFHDLDIALTDLEKDTLTPSRIRQTETGRVTTCLIKI